MKLLIQVVKDISPSVKDREDFTVLFNSLLKKINSGLKDAKAVLGGSGAKDTWLKDAHDADIFVLFKFSKFKYKSDSLSDVLDKHLRKKFKKIVRIHGSRDYFQLDINGFTLEIIPILNISNASQAKNITDISPLHTKWVRKHKNLIDDIRLTKKFCKAAKIYGAESYINGLSGYVCEILTIYYKSFFKFIKAASKWKDRVIIDIENHHKNVDLEVNKSKLISPLIIIDPVQPGRNASAAINKEKFDLFRNYCKKFVKKPSLNFFTETNINLDILRKKHKKTLLVIHVQSFSGKRDVVGSKLLRSFHFFRDSLERNGFSISDSNWEWDLKKKAFYYFVVKSNIISKTFERIGPPVSNKVHVKNFKKKYSTTFIKNKVIYATAKREFINAKSFIQNISKDNFLRDKYKKVISLD